MPETETQVVQPLKWYQKNGGIVLLLFLFFPAGLFLMWKHAKWPNIAKWIITAVFALLVITSDKWETTSTSVTVTQNTTTHTETPPTQTPKPEPTKPIETIYQLKQSLTSKTLEATITSVEQRQSVGSQYLQEKASEGGTLIVVSFQYKNISEKPVRSYTKPEIKLVDDKGTEYSGDLGKTSMYATESKLDSKAFSDLNPGITVKDAQVFEVSKEGYDPTKWQLKVKVEGKQYKVGLQ